MARWLAVVAAGLILALGSTPAIAASASVWVPPDVNLIEPPAPGVEIVQGGLPVTSPTADFLNALDVAMAAGGLPEVGSMFHHDGGGASAPGTDSGGGGQWGGASFGDGGCDEWATFDGGSTTCDVCSVALLQAMEALDEDATETPYISGCSVCSAGALQNVISCSIEYLQ